MECQHPNAHYYGDTNPVTYLCPDCGLIFVKDKTTKIYCNWDGFAWVWKEDRWLIDLAASGGPPSIHDPSPTDPPFEVRRK